MNKSTYLKAVESALEDGCTDAAEGGVPPQEVAERLDSDIKSVRRHLRRLVEEGCIKKVHGVDPETLRPRNSYVPLDTDARQEDISQEH